MRVTLKVYARWKLFYKNFEIEKLLSKILLDFYKLGLSCKIVLDRVYLARNLILINFCANFRFCYISANEDYLSRSGKILHEVDYFATKLIL